MISEKNLIRKAMRGHPEAFAELYKQIYKDLYRFALYTLKNQQDAEDVVSDTVTDAWAQISSLKKEESFKAWMFRILSNKCKQKLKSYYNRTEELTEELGASQGNQEEETDVRTAFEKLEAEERMILSMNLFGGYTSVEIGKLLEMNDSTVRSKQKRALAKMADYLR